MIAIAILCFGIVITTYYTVHYYMESQRYMAALEEYRAQSEYKAKYEEYKAKYEEYKAKYEEYKAKYEEYKAKYEAKYEEYKAKYEEYKAKYEEYKALGTRVNIRIDYGNGTRVWHNDTLVPLSCNLLNATSQVADVNYTVGGYGAIVESINGISNSEAKGYFWVWWFWDDKKLEWINLGVTPDRYVVQPGNIVCWYYQYALEYPLERPER